MEKNKIQIKNRIDNSVIFEFEKDNNTVRDTVEEAVRKGISLHRSYLHYTDLSNANLIGADLREADLSDCNLYKTDLRCVNLHNADLSGADLRSTYFYGANLCGVDLSYANLHDSYLCAANLYSADLKYADNIPFIPFVCPSEGSFIGWKKISGYKEKYDGPFLVKLLIPADAIRCSGTTYKCRCNKAKVLEITNINTGENVDMITNTNETPCVYKVGEMVYPDSFDDYRWDECSHGIHFFIDRQLAINYY